MVQKKSQSEMVTIILIVLVALAAIVIVWQVINKTIKSSSEQIGTEQFAVSLSSKTYDLSTVPVKISVSRSAGEGNLSAIKIVFYDNQGNVKIYTNDTTIPSELETVDYYIDLTALGITGNLTKYEVYPVVLIDGKEKIGIMTKVEISAGGSVPSTPSCTPRNCTYYYTIRKCGSSLANGTCSGTLSCTSCPLGKVCNGTDCISCAPKTCDYYYYNQSKTCGSNLTNGTCTGMLSCGCPSGEYCNGTNCVPSCTPRNCTYYYNQGKCGSSLSNGTCSGTLSCLSCPNGKICNGTDCIPIQTLSYKRVCGGSDNCVIENDDCNYAAHSSISVTETGKVYSPGIDVFVDAADDVYDACANTKITLTSPKGTKATLCDLGIGQACCGLINWVDTWYNDLSNFNGENINGTWTLRMCEYDVNLFSLNSWTLNITKIY